jgi:glycosyltransferase involved in cell wall biosynthesis
VHICLYHDAVIPPLKYGGTERIIYFLCVALAKLGHRTTLISKQSSSIPGTVCIARVPGVDWTRQIPADTDILHLWGTPQFENSQSTALPPLCVTIQGNGQTGETFHPNTVFISKKHAENHGSERFVYNGIDPNFYEIAPKDNSKMVFLAKANWPVKNLKGAIKIAQSSKKNLDVLGSRAWPFNIQKIWPRIGGVKYHGMVDDHEKRKVLSKSLALLFPVRWHEPFGIAMIEALASGCFVLGSPYGSLPEIIVPEVGHLSSNPRDLIQILKEHESGKTYFDPFVCRQRVIEKFSDVEMAKSYLNIYLEIIKKGVLGKAPKTLDEFRAQELLPWG